MGTISPARRPPPPRTVHPHGRGDNRVCIHAESFLFGSPPRAWGQLYVYAERTLVARFTPTGVGTISSSVSVGASSAVHPHGRGDNSVVARQKHLAFGSPPRAWGQYSADDGADRPVRFTPTGVGTMPRARPRSRPSAVHPHGRGDNGSPPETDRPSIGSPPRAWGQSPILA